MILRYQPGPEEIVPVPDEGLQGDQGNNRFGKGHADFRVQVEITGAVQGGRFEIAAGNLVEKSLVQIDIKAKGIEEGQQQGGIVIIGAYLTVHDELRQHDAGKGDHHPSHKKEEDEVSRFFRQQAADHEGAD